jgi:hypothetical protein
MDKSIPEAIQELTGKPASNEHIQKIMAAANVLGLRNNDPILMLLIVLEHYSGLYSETPARIKSAMAAAESAASSVATASIRQATAQMIPGVKKAVEEAAKQSIVTVQLGSSLITIWLGLISLCVVFALGWMMGSQIFILLDHKLITLEQFWNGTKWGIGGGFIVAPLMAASWYLLKTKKEILGWIFCAAAILLILINALNMMQVFHW